MLKQMLHRAAIVGLTGTLAALSGCILDPISMATGAMAEAQMTPEGIGATPAAYRDYNCDMLANTRETFQNELRKNRDDPRIWQWHIAAIDQVSVEKNCSNGATASVANNAAVNNPAINNPVTTAPRGLLGLRMDTVTPSVAQALALSPAHGALVIETLAGGGAEKAGIKPMDVILEIAGQEIQQPADVQAIVGRMRPGYRAPLRIWRKGSALDVAVEIVAPATVQASATPTAVTTSVKAPTAPQPAAASDQKKYCVAWLSDVRDKNNLAYSPIREIAAASSSTTASVNSLAAYITHVKTIQPGVWVEFKLQPEMCSDSFCSARSNATFAGRGQLALLTCQADKQRAEAQINEFANTSQIVPWP